MSELASKPSFTIPEAVLQLGVGRATVYRWIQSGELLCVGVRYHLRITRESLLRKLSQLSHG